MIITPYMGLAVWDSVTDEWNHQELADNFRKLDEHNHANGKGQQVPTGGIEDGAITRAKLAPETLVIEDQSIETRHLRDLAVTTPKIDFHAVQDEKIANAAVGNRHIRNDSVSHRHLDEALRRMIAATKETKEIVSFRPNGTTYPGQVAQTPRSGNQTDSIKLKLPPGGALVHFFAQGDLTIEVPADAQVTDFLSIRAYVQMNAGQNAGTRSHLIPLWHGRANNLTAQRVATWTSTPGMDWDPNNWLGIKSSAESRATTGGFSEMGYSQNSGGVISKFIPTGPQGETIFARMSLQISSVWTPFGSPDAVYPNINSGQGRKNPPNVNFGTQTFAVWTTSLNNADLADTTPPEPTRQEQLGIPNTPNTPNTTDEDAAWEALKDYDWASHDWSQALQGYNFLGGWTFKL